MSSIAVAGAGDAASAAEKEISRAGPAMESDDSEEEDSVKQFKVIVLGDGAVGKTSTLQRFANDAFGKSYKQTIGCDFFLKSADLPGGTKTVLSCWDIGGQNMGAKMLRNYIFGAHAVVLVYDITNAESFANCSDWLCEVKATFKDGKMPYLALVGNKTDMGHLRVVKPQQHKDFCDAEAAGSFYISAKSGDNVASMFMRIAAEVAGVSLTKPDIAAVAKVIPAVIVDHARDDPTVDAPSIGERDGVGRRKRCIIQ